MKRIIRGTALLLAVFVIMGCFTGCKKPIVPSEENPLLGVWKDTYDLTQYEFIDDEHLKLVTIGIASFDGTYVIDEEKMTIRLSMFGKTEEKIYNYRFEGDRFFLNDTEFVRKGT